MNTLLTLAAVAETTTGLALLVVRGLVGQLMLGIRADEGEILMKSPFRLWPNAKTAMLGASSLGGGYIHHYSLLNRKRGVIITM